MMIGIHIIERCVIAVKCLEPGVSLPLLILWTINGASEGGPVIVRIKKLITKRGKKNSVGQIHQGSIEFRHITIDL